MQRIEGMMKSVKFYTVANLLLWQPQWSFLTKKKKQVNSLLYEEDEIKKYYFNSVNYSTLN